MGIGRILDGSGDMGNGVDGIHGAVQHYGVHLLHHRPHQGKEVVMSTSRWYSLTKDPMFRKSCRRFIYKR